jgi:hypothetical protein
LFSSLVSSIGFVSGRTVFFGGIMASTTSSGSSTSGFSTSGSSTSGSIISGSIISGSIISGSGSLKSHSFIIAAQPLLVK